MKGTTENQKEGGIDDDKGDEKVGKEAEEARRDRRSRTR